jgi:hypothetical protein
MEKTFSTMLGCGLALLTLAGFTKRKKPKYFLGLMNVDTQHSLLRIPLTASLLYAGSRQAPLTGTRQVLTFVGKFYLAVGLIGSADRSLGRLLPSKLTNFDIGYHFGVGTVALWQGKRSGRMMRRS